MTHSIVWWIVFGVIVLGLLALDLAVFNRKAHEIHLKEALTWSAIWIGLSLLFCVGIYLWMGHEEAIQFLGAYLIEKSLSVDNIFVFIMLFTYFGVAPENQHKVLFWGIIGALVIRAAFIAGGVALLENFHWVMYIFGAFLIVTGIKMGIQKEVKVDPEKNPLIRLVRKLIPVAEHYETDHFFIRRNGRLMATPLFIVVLVVETTDLVFAVDSIPAVLAISLDPFIVYTSNVFAILGLRALYFAVAGIMQYFRYLRFGLVVILVFVGFKMIIADWFKLPSLVAVGVVIGVLAVSIIASVVIPDRSKKESA